METAFGTGKKRTRRDFLRTAGGTAAGMAALPWTGRAFELGHSKPLSEFSYSQVTLAPQLAETQFQETQRVLMGLDDDALLKPWRMRAGLPAPGPDMGGWYDELPLEKTPSGGHGFAPGHALGQWVSALSRGYAINKDRATKAKLERLLDGYGKAISPKFYQNFRFPAYNFDKVVIGLIDAHQFADMPQAFDLLRRTTDAAEQHLPPHALERDEAQRKWRQSVGENTVDNYTWDESYTLPENLYLAAERGAGEQYRQMARRYLLDQTYFDPLSRNENVLPKRHAYSFCNALSSAMQAYLADGSGKHLKAASNAFDMISAQSFATGGWGPNEAFVQPDDEQLWKSLDHSHSSFETPCGSYAHFKLTRYLLRVTGDGRYGDSMERVFYNTVLGAKPLEADGNAFYYSDYHSPGRKSYFPDKWPCCSGTLPQVTADYRLLLYMHDEKGIYANLYLPSTLKWVNGDGAQVEVEQTGDYPVGNLVRFRLRTARPTQFSFRLRIPAFIGLTAPDVRVNGNRVLGSAERGFFTVDRKWQDGDTLELRIPVSLRLEPITAKHPETVAVLRGPLVLFPISRDAIRATRQELVGLRRAEGQMAWVARTGDGPALLIPFWRVGDQQYWTYSVTV